MKFLQIIIIFIIAFLIIFAIKSEINKVSLENVKIDNIYFKAEIAKTDQDKATGLAKYNKIDNNFTIIFPFSRADYYTFWMKDMKFSIDIIYVRKSKIVDIFANVPYPKNADEALQIIRPSEKADTVLEINAGLSNKYKFKKGQSVEINY